VDPKLKEVAEILSLEGNNRSSRDLRLLCEYFKDNHFIAEQAAKIDDKSMQYMYKTFCLRECVAQEAVINYGDRGSLFYILIHGEVEIRVPNQVELQIKGEDFIVFCLRFFNDIFWAKITNGQTILKALRKEVEKADEKWNVQNPDVMEQAILAKIARGEMGGSGRRFNLLINPTGKP